MKYFLFCLLVLLSGCKNSKPPGEAEEGLPPGVRKFYDGPVTCYVYRAGISCLDGYK